MRYRLFQICCVIAEYDLIKTKIFIQHFIYMNFRTNLTQFYINFSRQEHQIESTLNYGSRSTSKMLWFQPIPLLFFLYSPFNKGVLQKILFIYKKSLHELLLIYKEGLHELLLIIKREGLHQLLFIV